MAADAPRALFPGSFDPPTLGHLDLIERAVALFGPLLVAVADNPAKSPVFSAAERVGLIEAMCTELPVEVVAFSGLVVDLAADRGITIDHEQLAIRLGCPVVPVVAPQREGLDALTEAIPHVVVRPAPQPPAVGLGCC